jgi:hypothetical protein
VQHDNEIRREQRQKEYKWPNRFFLKSAPDQNGAGHIGDIIILDAEPGPHYFEHMMPNDKGWKQIPVPCAKEFDNCPLCPPNGTDESAYVMLLTVLNLQGYWSKKENRQIHPTRELLVVKVGQHNDFYQLKEMFGTLRGLQLRMFRNGQRSPRIGAIDGLSQILDGTFKPQQHTDEAIVGYLTQMNKMGPDTYVNQQRKTIEKYPAGHMAQPFEYAEFLERPDVEAMRQRWGGSPPLGAYAGDDSSQWGNNAPPVAQPPAGYPPVGAHPPAGASAPIPTTVAPTTIGAFAPTQSGSIQPTSGIQPTTIQPGAQPQQPGIPPMTMAAPVRDRTPPQTENPPAVASATIDDDEIPF